MSVLLITCSCGGTLDSGRYNEKDPLGRAFARDMARIFLTAHQGHEGPPLVTEPQIIQPDHDRVDIWTPDPILEGSQNWF